MATIRALRNTGKLIPYETDLDIGEFRERWIDFAPSGQHWFEQVLPQEKAFGAQLTPLEQVEQIFHDYIIGRVMKYDEDRKRLQPDSNYVWELKTSHVRVFGWLPKKRHFIVVKGEMKRRVAKFKDSAPFIADVVSFRNVLDLDEPKHLEGIRSNEIC